MRKSKVVFISIVCLLLGLTAGALFTNSVFGSSILTRRQRFPSSTGGRFNLMGYKVTKTPYTFSSNDEVSINDMVDTIIDSGGYQMAGGFLTCETAAIRYVWGTEVTASQTVGHVLSPGQTFRFTGMDMDSWYFAPAVAGVYGTVQITLEF